MAMKTFIVTSIALLLTLICQAGCMDYGAITHFEAFPRMEIRYKQMKASSMKRTNNFKNSTTIDWVKVSMKGISDNLKELSCVAAGSPSPSISWVVNDQPLMNSAEVYEAKIYEGSVGNVVSRLYLPCVATAGEWAAYSCLASAGASRAYDDTQIRVTSNEEFYSPCLEDPPRITSYATTILQTLGKSVELFCTARGIPFPNISWSGPSGSIVANSTKYQLLENGSLVVNQLAPEDIGQYKCIAKNFVGDDFASTYVYPMLN